MDEKGGPVRKELYNRRKKGIEREDFSTGRGESRFVLTWKISRVVKKGTPGGNKEFKVEPDTMGIALLL